MRFAGSSWTGHVFGLILHIFAVVGVYGTDDVPGLMYFKEVFVLLCCFGDFHSCCPLLECRNSQLICK